MTLQDLPRRAWSRLPPTVRGALLRRAGPALWRAYGYVALPRPAPAPVAGPLVVAGLFRSASGIGEAARRSWHALRAAGEDPIAVDLTEAFTRADTEAGLPLRAFPASRSGRLILQLNAPETIPALRVLGLNRQRRWFIVGYWAWELEVFPTGWQDAFAFLSEVWTVSTFAQCALGVEGGPSVRVVPHPIRPRSSSTSMIDERRALGLPADAFITLVVADALSSLTRKNVVGAIAAHAAAFGRDATKLLVVKLRNAPPGGADLVGSERTNVRVVSRTMSDAERWALLRAADVVMSLHRAEGYGLVAAEAMSLGKPVIATGYSGNTDYMTSGDSVLVGFDLVEVADPDGVYPAAAGRWAEPDDDEAADALRRLERDPSLRRRLGDAARAAMAAFANEETVGQRMADLVAVPTGPAPRGPHGPKGARGVA